jgi:MFS family permease
MFEWYDFFLAAAAAATVWPKIFFPARFDPATALAVSVATLGISYVARPVGAFVFGHLGDKHGRRSTLVWTMILMGGASLATALIPPYASMGMLAIILVFVLRFLVGFGVGGESGGAFSWIVEARPNSKHRGFWISWPNAILQIGKLLSIFAFYLASSSLANPAYLDWGWRVPFAVGAVMLVLALAVRMKLMESPMFKELQAKRSVLKYPAIQVLREQWRKIFTLLWLDCYGSTIGSLVILPFSVSYLIALGVNDAFANLSVTYSTATAFIGVMTGGLICDYLGRKNVTRAGGLCAIAMLFPYFLMLRTLNPFLIIAAQILLDACSHIGSSANKALFTESFATKYRYSGSGLTYQIGASLVGVQIALVLPAILMAYGILAAWQPLMWVAIVTVLLSLTASFFVKETRGITLE